MLVLQRTPYDKGVVIILPSGELIEIFVQKIVGNQVFLGFDGYGAKILRGELYDRMKDKGEI